jgi:hypothetical protein
MLILSVFGLRLCHKPVHRIIEDATLDDKCIMAISDSLGSQESLHLLDLLPKLVV